MKRKIDYCCHFDIETGCSLYKCQCENEVPPEPKSIQILRDVETEVNISGIISNHTYSEIVKLLKEIDGNQNNK
jgi:hypothetical protein